MKNTKKVINKLLSVILTLTIVVSTFSGLGLTTSAATSNNSQTVADAGTAYTFENMMGTDADGNRYAGRVWVDKSVYTNGQTALLNTKGQPDSSFEVALEDDEDFQIIFSALGSSMTTTTTSSTTGPMDVVLVLDTSTSMDDTNNGVTRLQRVIESANTLIDDLLSINNVRLAIVTYNADSETVIDLDSYTNGVNLRVTNYYNNNQSGAGVVYAYDDNNNLLGRDSGYTMGTNLQSGIDRGFNILANAQNVDGRLPVAIVLTDGQANRAVSDRWYDLNNNSVSSSTGAGLTLSTLLNAAYNKAKIEANYGVNSKIYGVSVDLGENDEAHALMNPSDRENGFNSNNTHSNIRSAYSYFTEWSKGETVTINSGWYSSWKFDHNYPTLNGITRQNIIDNINYVDEGAYYDVSSAELESAFDQIYEELSSGAFNPITSSTTVDGATGVDNTPLIYVDNIGKYMEVKEIQAITLFGASYSVIHDADGTYTVASGTGINPTTNETWNTAEDIKISIIENADGTQRLEIRINQEILPIILERVVDKTIGTEHTVTLNELTYNPLRVYYTVGVASDVLLENGEIDVSKIDGGYKYIDDTTGEITFYSNAFGGFNTTDANSNGLIDNGDAHVGFKPSNTNRYYYHQSNQGIFTDVKTTDNSTINWDVSEYGIRYEEGKYEFTWLSYDNYGKLKDDDEVYTYVNYYHPTPNTTDAATAAEEVTYIVYTDWKYLKESVAFYDNTAQTYINYDATNGYTTAAIGNSVPQDKVAATIAAYKEDNANADIYAVLGVGSLRTSRLHNMIVEKADIANSTQTTDNRYAPEYTYETATIHNGNDVVVWLGNNGKVTRSVDTGIALTKTVTEAIGNIDDTYALTVKVPAGVQVTPVVKDVDGNNVTATISTYSGNVLTVNVKANETVYITGIPSGTVCEIGENINGSYHIASKTDTVTIPALSDVLGQASQYATANVTNAPNKHGNLYITKEITSDHTVPESIYDKAFAVVVNVGTALAGEKYKVADSKVANQYEVTVDANGEIEFSIKARQTIEILGLPEGTNVTVTEKDPGNNFAVDYRTRNHTGENADNDNAVVIPAGANATAVILNNYTPNATTVDLDIEGTKNFVAEQGAVLAGGTFNFKVQERNGNNWDDISGKEASVTYAADETGEKKFTIEDVLAGKTYTEIGSHSYQVIEVKGSFANITYDRTLYTFDVNVTDNGGQLEARVTDINNTEITDGTYEVTFNNTYNTAPASIKIAKSIEDKSGTNEKLGTRFGFTVTDELGKEEVVYSDAAGEAHFIPAPYKNAGVYRYTIRENIPTGATLVSDGEYAGKYYKDGWYYDATEYAIQVDVTNDNGNLAANITVNGDIKNSDNAEISFANVYDPVDISFNLDGAVKKELEGKALQANQFTFYVYNDGDRTTPILIGTNNLNGDVQFVDFAEEITYDSVGKVEYDIVEDIPTGAVYDAITGKYVLNGMSYDATVYDLVVEVTDNNGELKIGYYFEDSTTSIVTFHNSYKANPTEHTISGTKVLQGRALHAGEFFFGLYDENDSLIEEVTNKADGAFAFAAIPYTSSGVYKYTVKEHAKLGRAISGVEYDGVNHPVEVTVTVTDVNGQLVAEADVKNSAIKFVNRYVTKPATVTFAGNKILEGAELKDNMFTFNLYKTDYDFDITAGTPVDTKQNVDGKFTFNTYTFNTVGTYYFAITEDATIDPISNIVYDETQYNLTVQVRDNNEGKLIATVRNLNKGLVTLGDNIDNLEGLEVKFTNATFDKVTTKEVYHTSEPTVNIDGNKVKSGDILTYFIKYTNFTGKATVIDIVDTIPNHTSYVEGSASHNGHYSAGHINWVLNVAQGETVEVKFDVVVDETDAIVANTAVVTDGLNTYKTNEVVNHTIDEPIVKDVFNADEPTTSIDGKKVNAGDTLLYTIKYTNTTSNPVDIVIEDNIPEFTTYVENSADNNASYQNGKLVWKIDNLEAWTTVTVSFKVTVDANADTQNITNEAVVKEGNNTYTTNKIENHLEEKPESTPDTKPTPETQQQPQTQPDTQQNPTTEKQPESPKTGDNTNLAGWLAVVFISGAIIFATGKKLKRLSK